MNGMHARLTIVLRPLLLAGLLMTLTGCGPGRSPGVTPEPLTEMAPPQTTPDSGAVEPVVSLFQSPIHTLMHRPLTGEGIDPPSIGRGVPLGFDRQAGRQHALAQAVF